MLNVEVEKLDVKLVNRNMEAVRLDVEAVKLYAEKTGMYVEVTKIDVVGLVGKDCCRERVIGITAESAWRKKIKSPINKQNFWLPQKRRATSPNSAAIVRKTRHTSTRA
jgi:hypothetical protein